MKSIKIKLKKMCKKPCSYIRSVVKLLTPPQFEIIADFPAR